MDDDAESIIINQRYEYITRIIDQILTRGKHGYNGGEYVRLHEHKWTVEENFVYNGWAAPFQGIALCNNTLSDFENLDFSTFKLTEETKNEYIAELKSSSGLELYVFNRFL